MKTTHALVLVSLIGTGWLVVGTGRGFSQGIGDGAFGRKVAGTYLVDFAQPTPTGGVLSGQSFVTLGADGTYVSETTIDFGVDHPPRFKSGKHGTWKRTGQYELSLTRLGFDFGETEDSPVPAFGLENRTTGTIRVSGTIRFDRGYESFSESSSVEIFLAADGEDPLDPKAVPSIGPLPLTGQGRRVCVD